MDVNLQPGELFVGVANYRIRTLLGSCVSITLWHPPTRAGAMSHFLLPERGAASAGELDGRYGSEALQLILRLLAQWGIAPQQCQGKIFGGGNMFPGQTAAGAMTVGQRNGDAARALLRAHGIPIVSESLFGEGHRQIVFDTSCGDVWSLQVKPAPQQAQEGWP
ncbi:MAG: chemotaxis protein CheD [Burkholderiales bacterium]|nr:chemotaxis protein CheD [Burkholderiales bacterium]